MANAKEWKDRHIAFVTGRLAAEPLRATVNALAHQLGFHAEVLVTKISVAALMTVDWLVGKLVLRPGVDLVLLPGLVRGDVAVLSQALGGVCVERGPKNLQDLPGFFRAPSLAEAPIEPDIEILAEINHANRLSVAEALAYALRLHRDGADVIDLGATPGEAWPNLDEMVAELKARRLRVSIDSFDADEVSRATRAGAELVLSVNQSNVERAPDWGCEVVVLPDNCHEPDWLAQMSRTAERLHRAGVAYRLDPILDPIGFGFAQSLGRYLEVRKEFPTEKTLMGVGNLTELTAADSVGINATLIGFCQEAGISSVLTTQVIGWAQRSVREIDIARRIMKRAVTDRRPPKGMGRELVQLRDERLTPLGEAELRRLAGQIRDPNFRIFAENEAITLFNNAGFYVGQDPFTLFKAIGVTDASHAFYLGWEMMKAATALQLGKQYTQDQALNWGFSTKEEASHRLSSPSSEPEDGPAVQ